MAGLSDEAINAIKVLSGQMEAVECTVVSVDKSTLTCTVQPSDDTEAEMEGVRICSDSGGNTYFLPKVGSSVIIKELDSDGEAYLTLFSEIDDIALKGDNNGGLVIFSELVDVILTIKDAFTGVPVTPTDGGATGFSAIQARLAGITELSLGSMENKEVQHGSDGL